MLVPVKWLKDYVDINCSATELADKLVSCGFEIEEFIDLSEKIINVWTAKILEIERHPNADKLIVCTIDVGEKGIKKVVTNGTYLNVGDIVPVSLDGAKLFSGKEIHAGELRGVFSDGMFCGGSELGLTESDYKGAGEDKVLVMRKDTPIGTNINEIIGNDDVVLDIGITANRTDANSILGIAREISAVTGAPLKIINKYTAPIAEEKISDKLTLVNQAPDLCKRYMATMVTDVVIEESPEYIKKRLRSVGLRPINNIVDITNYVLWEIGQPMHAFDLEKIKGEKIVVRRAVEGEKIKALDDKVYTLKKDQLVICNAVEPMAIAGVMGGAEHSISNETKTIVFESANFARDNVRRTSRTLGLRSDSSARFEKGIDLYSQEVGMQKAIDLIVENGWGKVVGGDLDTLESQPETKTITFTASDINSILGVDIPESTMVDIMKALFFAPVVNNGEVTVNVPAFREDIVGINDIAEEIIRIYGYDHIETTLMKGATMVRGGRTPQQETMDKIKNILIGKGMHEIVTYSFISPKAWDMLHLPADDKLRNTIRLASPLGEDFSIMRTTLAYSMIKTIATNFIRGNKEALLFEVAKTYVPYELPLTTLPEEKNKLALGAYGVDFYDFKAIIEDLLAVLRIDCDFVRSTRPYLHPTRTAEIYTADGTFVGYMGEVSEIVAGEFDIDKRAYVAELKIEYLIDKALNFSTFKVIPKFQTVERDLALVVNADVEAGAILKTIKNAASEILISKEIFDVYQGGQLEEGKKSVAVKLTFQSAEATLKDADVNKEIDAILSALATELNANLR